MRAIGVFESGSQLAICVRDELQCFSSRRDKDRRVRVKLRSQAEQVAVECSAKALIGGDENDGALADLAPFEQGMGRKAIERRRFTLNAIKKMHERTPGDRLFLGLAQLGCSYQLHGSRDLRGVADGADSVAQFSRAMHSS